MAKVTLNTLFSEVYEKIDKAATEANKDLRNKLKEHINEDYYGSYDPKDYIRTYQLRNSVRSQKSGKARSGTIIFHIGVEDGKGYPRWDGKGLFPASAVNQNASVGIHGYAGQHGNGFWSPFLNNADSYVDAVLRSRL